MIVDTFRDCQGYSPHDDSPHTQRGVGSGTTRQLIDLLAREISMAPTYIPAQEDSRSLNALHGS